MNANKHIVLFDGACNFCSFWVKYVVKRDHKDMFRFTSLQSKKGQELLLEFKISSNVDSVVLIEGDKVFIKSTAALRILKTLGGLKSIFYGLIIVPSFIRDFVYEIIAKYRYTWFGKNDCEFVPGLDMKNKFLM
ncbi:MAG: DCC1-like thiol-disulfide oxidoreductase family protein [Vicingaceae bacterium]|nr:DCC1-like thiol-disulfide oxidoreductase family protein [Vicingaceae bacterium]